MNPEISTWEDLAKGLSGQVREQIERSFRRGYLRGADDMLSAVEMGVSIEALVDYVAEPLWYWFMDSHGKVVPPPKIPICAE